MTALASDFDGTLYFMRGGGFHEEDLAAIRRFQAGGGRFGISTGRSLAGVRDVVRDRISFDFYILVNGALILDGDGRPLYKRCVGRELISEVHERYRDRVEIIIQANDTVYNMGEPYPLQVQIDSIDDIPGDDMYGLSFGAETPEEAGEIAREVNRDYGDNLVAYANVWNIDIVPRGCSKGKAVQFIREHLRTDLIAGIGDSYNDLPMLESADVSFTFAHVPEELKKRADHIVDSVAGAIRILEKLS